MDLFQESVIDPDPLQVAAAFFPHTDTSLGAPTDIIFRSSDSVYFYCQQSILSRRSSNLFGRLLPYGSSTSSGLSSHGDPTSRSPMTSTPSHSSGSSRSIPIPEHPQLSPHNQLLTDAYPLHPVIMVEESSPVFNVILHIAYQMPVAAHAPDLFTLEGALTALSKYGLGPPPHPGPCDVWSILLKQSHLNPIRVYSLAAFHAIDAVCVIVSEVTLNASLAAITEPDSVMMGAIYLRRLFFLHMGRREALIRVITDPPKSHAPTVSCSTQDREKVERGWAVAAADVVIQPNLHNMSVDTLAREFGAVVTRTSCDVCQEHIKQRVEEVVKAWSSIKRTI